MEWRVTVNSEDDWITITPLSGDGDGSIMLTTTVTPGPERTASVTITGGEIIKIIQVVQAAPAAGENKPPVVDFGFEDRIDRYLLINKSKDPDGDVLSLTWESLHYNATINYNNANPYMLLPYSSSDGTMDVKLTVTDGIYTVSATKTLPLPQTTWYRIYELGTAVRSAVSLNVNYNWFIDQNYTGTYSFENCGPTCATMALKWVYPNFRKTVEDARNTYWPQGGWWYTNNIVDYLELNNAEGTIISFGANNSSNLISELDKGHIAILCLDMYYVRQETKGVQWPVDKHYYTANTDWGHFIVVKGYKIVGNHILFEVYDPASSQRYADGTNRGIDRLYRAEDLTKSSEIWWKYAIVVHPETKLRKGKKSSFNMENIPNQKGR
jgi:hypothetical protein